MENSAVIININNNTSSTFDPNFDDQDSLKILREKIRKWRQENLNVMVYPNTNNYTNGKQVLISDVMHGIRTRFKRKDKQKELLPVAYFSVVDFDGRKKNHNVKRHSGLIVFDIDKHDNPGLDFQQFKQDLKQNGYTYACFTSPHGNLKLIVNTNLTANEQHLAYFHGIKEYLLCTYTKLIKIDPSGCNIARACYLPYDPEAYYNPKAEKYHMDESSIEQVVQKHRLLLSSNNSLQVLLEDKSYSYDEHYDNMMKLLMKRTEVGLYRNIFNNYRYINIEEGGVMDSPVPFLEFIILKNSYPSSLDWETRIDEYYFRNNPQEQLNIISLGCKEGLEVATIGFDRKNSIIREHYRAMTLSSITMKLIFNNPFCHPALILRCVNAINDIYCEDPHPFDNPKPDEEEVMKIVMNNYSKYLEGILDFSIVIKRRRKTVVPARKYVFRSRKYRSIDPSITHLEAVRTYHKGKKEITTANLREAISALQDGKKITQKRIADHAGLSIRTVRRYMTSEFEELVDNYNKNVKSLKRRKPFIDNPE